MGLLALDMLRTADMAAYNYSGNTAASVGLSHPKDRVLLSHECPEWASVCDWADPMRLDIDF